MSGLGESSSSGANVKQKNEENRMNGFVKNESDMGDIIISDSDQDRDDPLKMVEPDTSSDSDEDRPGPVKMEEPYTISDADEDRPGPVKMEKPYTISDSDEDRPGPVEMEEDNTSYSSEESRACPVKKEEYDTRCGSDSDSDEDRAGFFINEENDTSYESDSDSDEDRDGSVEMEEDNTSYESDEDRDGPVELVEDNTSYESDEDRDGPVEMEEEQSTIFDIYENDPDVQVAYYPLGPNQKRYIFPFPVLTQPCINLTRSEEDDSMSSDLPPKQLPPKPMVTPENSLNNARTAPPTSRMNFADFQQLGENFPTNFEVAGHVVDLEDSPQQASGATEEILDYSQQSTSNQLPNLSDEKELKQLLEVEDSERSDDLFDWMNLMDPIDVYESDEPSNTFLGEDRESEKESASHEAGQKQFKYHQCAN